MSKIFHILVCDVENNFGFFTGAYLFGSSLYDDNPNDVDIILLYDEKKIRLVGPEKDRLENTLATILNGLPIDFTTLTVSEAAQVGFLDRITYRCIKCGGKQKCGHQTHAVSGFLLPSFKEKEDD